MSKGDRVRVIVDDGTEYTLVARTDGATIDVSVDNEVAQAIERKGSRTAEPGPIVRSIVVPHERLVAVLRDRVSDPDMSE